MSEPAYTSPVLPTVSVDSSLTTAVTSLQSSSQVSTQALVENHESTDYGIGFVHATAVFECSPHSQLEQEDV